MACFYGSYRSGPSNRRTVERNFRRSFLCKYASMAGSRPSRFEHTGRCGGSVFGVPVGHGESTPRFFLKMTKRIITTI